MPHKFSRIMSENFSELRLPKLYRADDQPQFSVPWFGSTAGNIAKLDRDDLPPMLGLSEAEQPWSRLDNHFRSKN